jgi:hypothetical protein
VIKTNPPNGTRWNGIPAKTLLRSDVEKLVAKRQLKHAAAEMRTLKTCAPEKMVELKVLHERIQNSVDITQKPADERPDAMFYAGAGLSVAPHHGPNMFIIAKTWVGLEEASRMVGLSRRLLRARILTGKLPALKDEPRIVDGKAQAGDCWRVKVCDLEAICGDIHGSETPEVGA